MRGDNSHYNNSHAKGGGGACQSSHAPYKYSAANSHSGGRERERAAQLHSSGRPASSESRASHLRFAGRRSATPLGARRYHWASAASLFQTDDHSILTWRAPLRPSVGAPTHAGQRSHLSASSQRRRGGHQRRKDRKKKKDGWPRLGVRRMCSTGISAQNGWMTSINSA